MSMLAVILIALMIATFVVMLTGIAVMAKGGEFNQKYGNRLMQLRVTLQAATLIVFALVLLARV